MTASFLEQMANSYPLIGMLSRGKFPSPLFHSRHARARPAHLPLGRNRGKLLFPLPSWDHCKIPLV